jgi:hypothetical protein
MVEKLRQAFERAQAQPEEEQNYLAELILRELEDQAWEESGEARAAIAEAHAELAAGEDFDYADYARARRAESD